MNVTVTKTQLLRGAVHATYIEPWRDWRRVLAYVATMLGAAGFTCIITAVPFDYASQGQEQVIGFSVAFFVCVVLMPTIYMMFTIADGKVFRIGVAICEIAAFYVLLQATGHPVLIGLMTSAVSCPYFAAYHVAMFRNTGDERRGFQVVLANVLALIAGAGAGLAAGWWGSTYGESHSILWAGAIGLVLATLGLLIVCPIQPRRSLSFFLRQAQKMAVQNPQDLRRWVHLGIANAPAFTVTAMLYVLGYSMLYVGVLVAMRIIFTAVVAPLMGKLIQKDEDKDFLVSSGLYAAAWLLLSFNPHSEIILILFILLSELAIYFMFISLEVKIYTKQSYSALALYELFIGIPCVLLIFLVVPILFVNPQAYVTLFACIMSALFLIEIFYHRRQKMF